MSAAVIRLEPVADGIVSLRISSDESPYLDAQVVPGLSGVVRELSRDSTTRVVLVEGGGRYFSGGASRESLLGADARAEIAHFCAEVPRLLLSIPVPTIALMEGHAVGGGLLIGLWCDMAFLAEESLYGANFMKLGFTPGMGATVLLEETLGGPLARELLFTGRMVKGRELKAGGGPLAHAVGPRATLRQRALSVAEEISEGQRAALVLLKQELASRRRHLLESALESEREMHAQLFETDETKARIAESYEESAGERDGGTDEGD